ncbi:MAG: J domain-containing protein [Deltaproteobacteria bacterium]|nr:J domain-containing protein [Deltaproteobacteria bacterium]
MEERRRHLFDARDVKWMGGEIGEEGAARVLLDLSACRVTGMWEIYSGSRVYRLAMRSGVPIHAFPGSTPWLLGEVLAFLGAPLKGDAEHLKKTLALNPGRSGEVLVEHGIVHRKFVDWALKEQISLRAAEFLPLVEGRYRLWSGPQFLKSIPRQPNRWRSEELAASIGRPSVDNDDLRLLLERLTTSEDPRHALGLSGDADPEKVRSTFLELAKHHHPDRIHVEEGEERLSLHRLVFEASVRAYKLASAA